MASYWSYGLPVSDATIPSTSRAFISSPWHWDLSTSSLSQPHRLQLPAFRARNVKKPHRKSNRTKTFSSALPFDLSPPPIDEDLLEAAAVEGARISDDGIIETFHNDDEALDAANNGVVVVDLSHFGRIRVSGEDRYQFLHNQSTANFESLCQGQGCSTVFVSPTARTIDIAQAWIMKNAITLIVSPVTHESIIRMLNKYIFLADKVEIQDITKQTSLLVLVGPKSNQIMEDLNLGEIAGQPYGTHQHFSEVEGKYYSSGVSKTAKSGNKRSRCATIVGPGIDKDVAHEAVGVKPSTLVPKEIPMIKKKNPVFQIRIGPKVIHDGKDDNINTEQEEPENEAPDLKPYATLEDLERGKLPPEEILSLPMFKNYTAGSPTSVLYIKNLAKDVVNDDLYYIFGSLFGGIDEAKSALTVKLMQEGRMRGQAFVTFPSVEFAQHALNLVNGYVFKGKPMIIQFGRNPGAAKGS